MLQVGFSSVENRDIEHSEFKGDRRTLFKDLHFLIATTSKSFGDDWKPMLTRLGAAVSVRSKGRVIRYVAILEPIFGMKLG